MPEMKNNVPKLRFPGFTDIWEQRKLPEFVDFYNGLTYTPDDVREDGTLVLRSSNVKNGEIVDADNVYVNPKIAKSDNVRVGDIIVVVRNGSRALIGKHATIKENMPNTVIGAFMSGIRSEHPAFVNALLDTLQFGKEIEKNMGATINQITAYMFAQMEFRIPSLAEQKHIGDFFRSLDNLIALHQRKCDEIREYKIGMLQKMFPKDEASSPEIRFSGFKDGWKQCKLGDVGKAHSGVGFPEKEQGGTTGIPFFKVSDMNTVGNESEMSIANNYVTDAQIAAHKWTPIDELPAIFFAKVGAAVMMNRKRLCRSPFLLDNNTMAYSFAKDKLDADFAKVLFDTIDLTSLVQIGALPSYSSRDVEGIAIRLPEMSEQLKIGAFFKHIENRIILQQRKVERMKEYKKGLLQQLFV